MLDTQTNTEAQAKEGFKVQHRNASYIMGISF